MPRYLIVKRRGGVQTTSTAHEMIAGEPGVTVLDHHNPDMVLAEVSEDTVERLRQKLGSDFSVEQEVRRALH